MLRYKSCIKKESRVKKVKIDIKLQNCFSGKFWKQIFDNLLFCYYYSSGKGGVIWVNVCNLTLKCNTESQPYTFVFWTHFSPILNFYTPWKFQKTFGFLTFSGGKKWNFGLKWVNQLSWILSQKIGAFNNFTA